MTAPPDLPAYVADGFREHLEVVDAARALGPAIERYAEQVIRAFAAGNKVLSFGNGGSAADAQHLVAELIGRFSVDRRPLAAVAVSVDPSVMTCIANDFSFDDVFARQVTGLARPGDVVVGFTTSGTSRNVIAGLEAGRARGAVAIALTGADPRAAADAADLVLAVPSRKTARIQEVHLLITHLVSEWIDAWALEQGDR